MTNLFFSLNLKEDAELKATGNFGGGKDWFSGQVKNLPPQQTDVNMFEIDLRELLLLLFIHN